MAKTKSESPPAAPAAAPAPKADAAHEAALSRRAQLSVDPKGGMPAPAPVAPAKTPLEALPEGSSMEDAVAAARKQLGLEEPPPEGDAAPPEDAPDDGEEPAPGEKLLAGKYKSVEELEKGYHEVVKKLTTKGAGSLKTTDAPKPDDAPAAPGAWTELNESAVEELGAEWYANDGDLKPETYQRLQKDFKMAPEVAKAAVSAIISAAESQNAKIVQEAGFADFESFNAARSWAAQTMNKAQREALDQLLSHRSPIHRAAGVRLLRAEHSKANPAPRKRVAGEGSPTSEAGPITSQHQFNAEMAKIQEKFADQPERIGPEVQKLLDRRTFGK